MQIGEYDSDDGELWDDDDDDDEVNLYDSEPELADSQGSWETESEHSVNEFRDRVDSENGGPDLRSRLAASIGKVL